MRKKCSRKNCLHQTLARWKEQAPQKQTKTPKGTLCAEYKLQCEETVKDTDLYQRTQLQYECKNIKSLEIKGKPSFKKKSKLTLINLRKEDQKF